MDIQITDEHLTKLDIKEDSVLVLRMPTDLMPNHQDWEAAYRVVKKRILVATGFNPLVIAMPRDIEVDLLDREALQSMMFKLRAELDVLPCGCVGS